MGMAASQARLLSITSRMADNELRAQIANNAKMRLAADSSRISADYVNALNNATMMISNFDEAGDSQFSKLNFNRLTQYSPFNTQYGLANSYGQLLVNENEAKIFEAAGGSLTNYLKAHGLEFTTSYFDAESFTGATSIKFEDEMGKSLGEFTLDELKALYFGDGGVHLGYDANIEAYETYKSQITNFSMHYQKAQQNDKIMGLVDQAIINSVNSISKLPSELITDTRYNLYHDIPVSPEANVFPSVQGSIQAVLKTIYNISNTGEGSMGGYNEAYVDGATTRFWESVVEQYLQVDEDGKPKINDNGDFILKPLDDYGMNTITWSNGQTYFGDLEGGISETLFDYNKRNDTNWGAFGSAQSESDPKSAKIGSKPCSDYDKFTVKFGDKEWGIENIVVVDVQSGMEIEGSWGYSLNNVSLKELTLPPGSVGLVSDGTDLYMIYPQISSDDDVSRLGVAFDGKYFRNMWCTANGEVFGELLNTLGRLEQVKTDADEESNPRSFMRDGDFIGMDSGDGNRIGADTNTLHELDSYIIYKVSAPEATASDGNIKAYIEDHAQQYVTWGGDFPWVHFHDNPDKNYWRTNFIFSDSNRRVDPNDAVDAETKKAYERFNTLASNLSNAYSALFMPTIGEDEDDSSQALITDANIRNNFLCSQDDYTNGTCDRYIDYYQTLLNNREEELGEGHSYDYYVNWYYPQVISRLRTYKAAAQQMAVEFPAGSASGSVATSGTNNHTFQFRTVSQTDENGVKKEYKVFTVDNGGTDKIHAWTYGEDGAIRDVELYQNESSAWRAILDDLTEFAFGHSEFVEGDSSSVYIYRNKTTGALVEKNRRVYDSNLEFVQIKDGAATTPATKGQFRYSVNLMSYINDPSLDNEPEVKNLRAIRDKIYAAYGINLSTTPATDFTYIGSYIDTLKAATQDPDPKKAKNAQAVYDSYILDCLFDIYGEPNVTWIDKKNPEGDAEAKVNWYTNLFERMSRGYKVLEDGLANSNEWIEYALESGLVSIEQVDKENRWNGTVYSNVASITEVTDEVAVARAEAEYKRAMNEVENKDKRLDIELKNIDTEHNALQTEYESVKSVISKNVERTFKMYS